MHHYISQQRYFSMETIVILGYRKTDGQAVRQTYTDIYRATITAKNQKSLEIIFYTNNSFLQSEGPNNTTT